MVREMERVEDFFGDSFAVVGSRQPKKIGPSVLLGRVRHSVSKIS